MLNATAVEARKLAKVFADLQSDHGVIAANVLWHRVVPPWELCRGQGKSHVSEPWRYYQSVRACSTVGPFDWNPKSPELVNALLRLDENLEVKRMDALFDNLEERLFYSTCSLAWLTGPPGHADLWQVIVRVQSCANAISVALQRSHALLREVSTYLVRKDGGNHEHLRHNMWADACKSMCVKVDSRGSIANWFLALIGLSEAVDNGPTFMDARCFGRAVLSKNRWELDAEFLPPLTWTFADSSFSEAELAGRPFVVSVISDVLRLSGWACEWIAEALESLPAQEFRNLSATARSEKKQTATNEEVLEAMQLCIKRGLNPSSKIMVGKILRKEMNRTIENNALNLMLKQQKLGLQ